MLAVFNMLPLLPLDGGRVLGGLLPPSLARPFFRTERYGMTVPAGPDYSCCRYIGRAGGRGPQYFGLDFGPGFRLSPCDLSQPSLGLEQLMASWIADDDRDAPETAPEAPAVAEEAGAPMSPGESPQPVAVLRRTRDDAALAAANDDAELRLDLDGYEGPIDILLALARDQKVDLEEDLDPGTGRPVSVLHQPRPQAAPGTGGGLPGHGGVARLPEIAPAAAGARRADGEPTGIELAAALAFQLQRLEAMQKAGQAMLMLPSWAATLSCVARRSR